MNVLYLIKAHDHMFPGRPDVYYYGLGSSTKSEKTVHRFGVDVKQAFVVEATTEACAKLTAEIIAKGITSPSIKPWVVRLSKGIV